MANPNPRTDQIKKYQFKPGQSGNPTGKKGPSLKRWTREYLSNMSDEDRAEFLSKLDPHVIWKMSEGNPHSTNDGTVKVELPIPLLEYVRSNDSDKKDTSPEEEA